MAASIADSVGFKSFLLPLRLPRLSPCATASLRCAPASDSRGSLPHVHEIALPALKPTFSFLDLGSLTLRHLSLLKPISQTTSLKAQIGFVKRPKTISARAAEQRSRTTSGFHRTVGNRFRIGCQSRSASPADQFAESDYHRRNHRRVRLEGLLRLHLRPSRRAPLHAGASPPASPESTGAAALRHGPARTALANIAIIEETPSFCSRISRAIATTTASAAACAISRTNSAPRAAHRDLSRRDRVAAGTKRRFCSVSIGIADVNELTECVNQV